MQPGWERRAALLDVGHRAQARDFLHRLPNSPVRSQTGQRTGPWGATRAAGLGLGPRGATRPTERPLRPQSCLGRQQLLAAVRQMQQLLKGQETRFAEGLRLMRSRLSALHATLSKAAPEPPAGESRGGQGPRRAPLQASAWGAEGQSTGSGVGISADGATRHGWAGKA